VAKKERDTHKLKEYKTKTKELIGLPHSEKKPNGGVAFFSHLKTNFRCTHFAHHSVQMGHHSQGTCDASTPNFVEYKAHKTNGNTL
jgi:hypothetical protein